MGSAGKICVKCGEDCSGRARTKDARGRYMCNDCLGRVKAARSVSTQGADGATAGADEEAIPLADDPAGILAAAQSQPAACPGCGLLLPHGAVLCTRCGYNTRTGRAVTTVSTIEAPPRAGAPSGARKCVKCGYDLSGLKVPRCPECGTFSGREERRRASEAKAAAAIRRNEYIKPVVTFAIGLALTIGLLSAIGADPQRMFVALMMKHAFFVPVGLVIYFMCCVMWLGFDAPFHLIALRLAAAFAVTDVVVVFAGFFGIVLWITVVTCTLAICLHQLMDHDIPDALIVSVLLTVTQYAILMAIAAQMR